MFTRYRKLTLKEFALVAAVSIVVINIAIGIYVRSGFLFTNASFSPEKYVQELASSDTDIFSAVRDSLKLLVAEHGVQNAIDVNTYAFQNHKYGIYQCHVIMHLLGHQAVAKYRSDFDSVINAHVEYCELGYQHGAEAEVVLANGDYKQELYRMCRLIKDKNPSANCFHGAGHAFMSETLDVHASLKLCDELTTSEFAADDYDTCYNSVFAELTNLVGGTDGGTGLEYTGGPPLSIGEKTPIQYCSEFEGRYRTQCLFELSGLNVNENSTADDVGRKLEECLENDYEEELESACIQSVAAVGAQHQLAHSRTLEVPGLVITLTEQRRHAYIIGAGTEMSQYIMSGVDKDWEAFCELFENQVKDLEICTDIFKDL
jgi:hypothetical protein